MSEREGGKGGMVIYDWGNHGDEKRGQKRPENRSQFAMING
jgi:hypothetical protein